jgi:hypothetical protein
MTGEAGEAELQHDLGRARRPATLTFNIFQSL